jgi:hypothetical protein
MAPRRDMQVIARARIHAALSGARRQRGFVAILTLVLLVLGSLYAIVGGLSTAATEARLHREDANALVLQQAKEALTARAAFDLNRPGSLPCPDRDNDGEADLLFGTNCPSYVGRLPWKTLGLPDLRDASGERLWYALSQNFTDSSAFAINSDTQGTLSVPGMAPTGGVVAIVFAPGTVVGAQLRTGPGGASPDSPCAWGVDQNCRIANYLEGQNASVDTTYEQSPRCERADCPGNIPFNDQLAIITHADLFAIVEPVVARRIAKEIVPKLTDEPAATGYFERWGLALYGDKRRGFFPFAAPYDDPARAQDLYQGVLSQTNGLLPLSRDTAAWVLWSNVQVVKTNPLALGTIDSGAPTPSCVAGGGGLECTLTYTCDLGCGGLGITVTARLQNAAKSLLLPTGVTDAAGWSLSTGGSASSVTAALDAATGDLLLTVTLTAPAGPPMSPLVVVFPTLTFSEVADPADWFVMNGWHRQTYYAVATAFHPASNPAARDLANPCPATPSQCVQVVGGALPAKARAVLVLAGRHLGTGTRTYTIANYFEDQNFIDTPPDASGTPVPDYIFERKLRSKTFNDRLVVVATEP